MIKNNPYRILGVLANTSIKEIQKNLSKLKAHLAIGKELKLSFDDDFFGVLTRDDTALKKAKNLLQLDNNKLEQALFWLVNANEIDGVAIEYIKKGNIAKALGIWEKQVQKSAVNAKNFSFYNNLSTLLFAKKEYSKAIKLKSELIESKFIKNFSTLVCGDKYKVEKSNLLDMFIEITMSALKEPEIIQTFSESSQNINEIVSNLFVKGPIANIESAIKNAKKLIEDISKIPKLPEIPISSEDFDEYSKIINDSNDTEEIEITDVRALHKTKPSAAWQELQHTINRMLVSPIPDYQFNEDTGELYVAKILIESGAVIKESDLDIIICSGIDIISLSRNDVIAKTAGNIGRELMRCTKKDINKLKKVLGSEHFSYSLYADKLASQLEQCGVAYYNQTSNDLDYTDIYKYALVLAQGEIIKNKLKEALKHSNNEKKSKVVDFVVDAIKVYDEKLQNWKDGHSFKSRTFQKKQDNSNILGNRGLLDPKPLNIILGIKTHGILDNALKLLETCKPVLNEIKTSRGEEDELYLSLSGGLVNRILNTIIAVENEDRKTIDYYIKHAEFNNKRGNISSHINQSIRKIENFQFSLGNVQLDKKCIKYRTLASDNLNSNKINLEKSCRLLDSISLLSMTDESLEYFNNNESVIRKNYELATGKNWKEEMKTNIYIDNKTNMWICKKCNEECENSFDACWKCSSLKDPDDNNSNNFIWGG
ncbi:MAG: Uncharacterised protein [Cryomorphaceae bacterium]|nr:MAG: Uncharacterised protein [Cryomorphaceae bacterium]